MLAGKARVFIINGKGGVGKDTFVDIAKDYIPSKVFRKSSVSTAKDIAMRYFGWNGSKTEKDRKLLSDLKDLLIEYDNLPYKEMCKEIEGFVTYADEKDFLFLFVREPDEISKLVSNFPFIKTILVTNKNVEEVTGNHADERVTEYLYDYTVENNGTIEQLKNKVERLMFDFL